MRLQSRALTPARLGAIAPAARSRGVTWQPRVRGAAGRRPAARLLLAAALLMPAGPLGAQTPEERGAAGEGHVRLMEQALEQAVRRGVDTVEQRLPAPAPGLIFFAGAIQARGFVVDDYGLFFDVEYPVVRRSILWSMGLIEPLDGGMARSLHNLRLRVLELPAAPARSALEQALRALERLPRPAPASPESAPGPEQPPVAREAERLPTAAAALEAFYQAVLRGALADAVVAHGGALPPGALADREWLAIGARDGRVRRGGERRTLQLRIRGGHLRALRDGRVSLEDTRARIEVR